MYGQILGYIFCSGLDKEVSELIDRHLRQCDRVGDGLENSVCASKILVGSI
jgi:hypothetical protein